MMVESAALVDNDVMDTGYKSDGGVEPSSWGKKDEIKYRQKKIEPNNSKTKPKRS